MWTAAQIRRQANKKDTVGWDDTSESVEIPNTADVVLTMNQTEVEEASGTGRIFISKNRDGKRGVTINVKIKPEIYTIR